jgi:putative IMPACT (imprinted ancient) family translation regulator
VRSGDGRGGHLLREWSSDDGEPSGSAGKPALNVLTQRDLENVAAVVTRHFGGTELGVGGLARAYSQSVSLAVDDAGIVERRPHRRVGLEVEYDDSGTVRGLLESADVTFEAEYAETVRFDVRLPADDADGLLDRLRSGTSGRVSVDDDP